VTGEPGRSIDDVRRDAEADLLSLPHVVGVGVGKSGDEPVIKVFVERKAPLDERVPSSLEGFAVQVEEIGHVTAHEERP
jgi:hypothetical protein